jgi:hypothetical protein
MPEDRCGGSLAGSESVNVFLSYGDQRKVRAGPKMNE